MWNGDRLDDSARADLLRDRYIALMSATEIRLDPTL
jgi:hypothetical protein